MKNAHYAIALLFMLGATPIAGFAAQIPVHGRVCLKPQSLEQPIRSAQVGSDPLSAFRKSPMQVNHHEDLLWYDAETLNSMGQAHSSQAAQRENRQHHFQQTQQDEINFVNEQENRVGHYIRSALRRKLLALGNSIKNRFEDGLKEKKKSDQFAERQQNITVTRYYLADKKAYSSSSGYSKTDSEKGKVTVTHVNVSEDKGLNIGQSVERAFHAIVRVGRNMIERHQPIDISEDAQARLKFDVPMATMRMDFESELLNADAQYRLSDQSMPFTGGGSLTNPMSGPQLQNLEKATVALHKNLKIIDLGASVRYGIDSGNLTYGLTKNIFGPLNASVSRLEALGGQGASDTTFQLSLGVGL